MKTTQKYQLAEDVSLTDVDDEIVLLDLKSGQYFGLDAIGSLLLKDLLAQGSLARASDSLAAQYNVDAATVLQDTKELIEQLLSKGLIELAQQTECPSQ